MLREFFFIPAFFLLILTSVLLAGVEKITINVDHENQLYKCGEAVNFTVTALNSEGQPAKEGKITLCLQNCFWKNFFWKEIDLSQENPIHVQQALDVPGFLTLSASCGEVKAQIGCGVEVEKIQPAAPCPEDFNEYWAEKKKQVRALPEDFKLEEIPEFCNDQMTVYRLSIRTLGENSFSHGFLSVPKNQGDGPFPLFVLVPGAGPGTGPDLWMAKRGIIALYMNVFPYPVSLNGEERKKQYDDFHKTLASGLSYSNDGAKSRETYFFFAPILGIDRAIDVVAARPDVDKKRIIYQGGSQGGAFGLFLGGLSDRWTAILVGVPAMCDHDGAKLDRAAGWPKIYHSVKDPAAEKVGPYFDAVNFARNIKCPIRVTVGFIDMVCSPTSVYSAYNVLPSADKQMGIELKRGHELGEKFHESHEWLMKMIDD